MTKFTSLVFNEVSGKMGAVVLGKNGTVRRNVVPKNLNRSAQQAVRSGFSAASAAWKVLTPVGQAAPSVAPVFVPGVPGLPGFAVTVAPPSVGHVNGQITLATGSSAGGSLVVRATGRLSPDGNALGPSDFRVLATVPAGTVPPTRPRPCTRPGRPRGRVRGRVVGGRASESGIEPPIRV